MMLYEEAALVLAKLFELRARWATRCSGQGEHVCLIDEETVSRFSLFVTNVTSVTPHPL